MSTFAVRFCERYNVRPENYADAVFRRCLHRRARLFVRLLRAMDEDYFLPDYELIRNVGQLSNPRAVHDHVADFHDHPKSSGVLHRRLHLRISVRRVIRLLNEVLRDHESVTPKSRPPFKSGNDRSGGPASLRQ